MSKNLAQVAAHVFPIFFLLWLAGCAGGSNDGGSGGGGTTTPVDGGTNYTVGGTVSGLSGTVALQNNGGNDLRLSADSAFAFTTTTLTGSNYSVTVLTQPAGQICAVASGAGTVSGANVTDVKVTCSSSLPPASLALLAGDVGAVDGIGAAARFVFPRGIATDSAGNVYVADGNNTIRKITPAGAVTTLAGKAGVSGFADATGTAATFNGPAAVATDSAGNVYVADEGNDRIRKVTPAGVVTTFATAFFLPQGVATDSAGNVYVGVSHDNVVDAITPAGEVSLFAGIPNVNHGGSTDSPARFAGPTGVATDSASNVYVADSGNATIRKITPAGVVTTFAGTAGVTGSTDATGAAASFGGFGGPLGVATDGAGNVYVADTGNNTIRKITPIGAVSTLAGTAGVLGSTDATGAAASFNHPSGVAADSAGNVYVADSGNNIIRKITAAGVVTTLAGTAGVSVVNTTGTSGSTDATGAAARFNFPVGVASDAAGNVYVGDTRNNTIRKITPAGAVTTFAGTAGVFGSTDATGAAASFNQPTGVAVDSAGNVYVADTINNTIRKITPAGVVTTFAGTAGAIGDTDAAGAAARFWNPVGLAIDSADNIYVTDLINSLIRKITPAGVVTRLAGSGPGNADGPGTTAKFLFPRGIAADRAGNVYVADTNISTIRKITPAGLVTTFAGTSGATGSTDATGAAARFNFPTGVATDSADNVYVLDGSNDTIRKITPAGVVSTVVGVTGQAGFAPGPLPGLLHALSGLAVSGTSLYITLDNGVAAVRNLP